MASNYCFSISHLLLSLFALLALTHFPNPCFSFNLSAVATHWGPAGATWYGSPDGAGSDGGACGYGNAVSQAPFSSLVFGASPSLYKGGKECGACYQIKCTSHPSCSGKPVRVVITDLCPGGPCLAGSAHFDLSGTAFGAMAKPGEGNKLRDAGVLDIEYARVACEYAGRTIAFHVDQGSNPSYFAVVIEFEAGDGDLGGVYLKQTSSSSSSRSIYNEYSGGDGGSNGWLALQQSWGAVWMINAGHELEPPFSLRLMSQFSGQTLVANDVIPRGWQPGATYRSVVNFS